MHEHPIKWNVPTYILYGEGDDLTSIETISAFVAKHQTELTVMPKGEHWFHTAEQMLFLDEWIKSVENITINIDTLDTIDVL